MWFARNIGVSPLLSVGGEKIGENHRFLLTNQSIKSIIYITSHSLEDDNMELCTEFLIHIDKRGGIATTDKLKKLIKSEFKGEVEEIDENSVIIYQSVKSCRPERRSYGFTVKSGNIYDTNVRFYHIFITCVFEPREEENCLEIEKFRLYQEFLTALKQIFYIKETEDSEPVLKKDTVNFEILWDDVSRLYSKKAYSMIYEIENLMRKLITKFMLTNVAPFWGEENMPRRFKYRKPEKVDTGRLYNCDFIELSTFLFDKLRLPKIRFDTNKITPPAENISRQQLTEYYKSQFEANSRIIYENTSNWDRYFAKYDFGISKDELKRKWVELYELRCLVAHNNQFTNSNYEKVKNLTNELKPIIEKAIESLDGIEIDLQERKQIYEASMELNSTQLIRCFFKYYKNLIDTIADFIIAFAKSKVGIYVLIRSHGNLSELLESLQELKYNMNKEVKDDLLCIDSIYKFCDNPSKPPFYAWYKDINGAIDKINEYITYFEAEKEKYEQLYKEENDSANDE